MTRVLIKTNNWLGDAIMSLPAIQGLKRMLNAASISILTRDYLTELYNAVDCVDEIIPYSNWLDAVKKLSGRRFDIGLIFPRSLSSCLMTLFAKIPRKIGYSADGRSILLSDPVARTEDKKMHRVCYFYNLLRALGKPPAILAPRLKLSEDLKGWAGSIMKKISDGSRYMIGLNPGAIYGEAKRWLPDRFAALGKKLLREFDCKILVFGSKAESELAQEIAKDIGGNCYNLAGATTILQAAALIERLDLFVTNDTGTMHLADVLNVPIVAIFGSTNPCTTGPFGKNHIIVRHDIDCSPCLKRTCPYGHLNCMKLVTIHEVYDACIRLLKKHA